MISVGDWEGLVVAVCTVGGFGMAVQKSLKSARQKQIDAAIEKARLEDEIRRLKGDDGS